MISVISKGLKTAKYQNQQDTGQIHKYSKQWDEFPASLLQSSVSHDLQKSLEYADLLLMLETVVLFIYFILCLFLVIFFSIKVWGQTFFFSERNNNFIQ